MPIHKEAVLFSLKDHMDFYRRVRQSKAQRTQRDSARFGFIVLNDKMLNVAEFLCALCVKRSCGFLPQSQAK